MKNHTQKLIPSVVLASCFSVLTAQAQFIFTAGTAVSTGGLANVNNPIDLSLADFANNAATALTGYNQTINNNAISGTITRTDLANGSLLTTTQFNTLLTNSQAANTTSGVIYFNPGETNGTTGTNDNASFGGTNSTGSITVSSNTSLSTSFNLRTFNSTGDVVGTGSTNSIGIAGYDVQLTGGANPTFSSRTGYLNLNQTTLTFSAPMAAAGFTQLQRDATRTYIWKFNLVNLSDSNDTSSVEVGRINFTGLSIGASSGGSNAENYRYDTFVGYQAPEGYGITSINWSGGAFGNIDGLAYVAFPGQGGGTFADWLTANPPATGFDTDSDNDGVSNGVENLLGTDPNVFSQGLTQVSATANSSTFVHSVSATPASDVTLSYQWSTDLVEWKASGETNTGGITATITPSAPVAGNVTVTTSVPPGASTKLFTRLVATQAP